MWEYAAFIETGPVNVGITICLINSSLFAGDSLQCLLSKHRRSASTPSVFVLVKRIPLKYFALLFVGILCRSV